MEMENIHNTKKSTDKSDFVFVDLYEKKSTQIAHICKSHMPTHKPKFAKECHSFEVEPYKTILIN